MNLFADAKYRVWSRLTIVYLLVLTYGSLNPHLPFKIDPWAINLSHIPAYGLLAFLIAKSYLARKHLTNTIILRNTYTKILITVFCVSFFYGVLIEILQPYTGRFFSYMDIFFNGMGALMGIGFIKGVRKS